MNHVAKLFINGRSQAVRLPLAFRFDTKKIKAVFIRKDPETGDVILSCRPPNWDDFFSVLNGLNDQDGFLDEKERKQTTPSRDPFEGWRE